MSDLAQDIKPSAVRRTNMDLLKGVSVRVSVEVGSASLRLCELLDLDAGSVVQLDREADDYLDIFANGTLIARGEIVGVEGRYAVRLIEVVASDPMDEGVERRS